MLPYTYVPGRCRHPIREEGGHQLGGFQPQSESLSAGVWRECDAYHHAIDLFNAGFYWEAHEVWEGCWHEAGRRGDVADFLKGLIKLAAALVKAREGRLTGIHRHGARAVELFQLVSNSNRCHDDLFTGERFAGMRLADLIRLGESLQATDSAWLATQQAASVTEVTPLIKQRLTCRP